MKSFGNIFPFSLSFSAGYSMNKFIFSILCLSIQLLLSTESKAQYSKLFDFGSSTILGFNPDGSLISDGTYLYGMTSGGGSYGGGNVFKILPDGSGYVDLHDFINDGESTDGNTPYGSLYFDGTFLYGMTSNGGTANLGTIFKIMPDGTGYSKLLNFFGTSNGSYPNGSLISDGTFLYGTTSAGGIDDLGTVFKIKPDGTGYTRIFQFTQSNGGNVDAPLSAIDGSNPEGDLFYDGTFLYGTANSGGINNLGTIFKIKPDGTNFVKLLDFDGTASGSFPGAALISDGTFLYGTTSGGGSGDSGTLFKILTDGSGYTKLLDMDASTGQNPYGSFISDGTFLYGLANGGGANGNGTVFKIKMDGTSFIKLFDFKATVNGNAPYGSLLLQGSVLYGMTDGGGQNGDGIIFKIQTDGTNYSTTLNFGTSLVVSGTSPQGSLTSDATFLYGMTSSGGMYDYGTVFKAKPDGTAYTTLLDFSGSDGSGNSDGSNPMGSLFYDGSFLYGMTSSGGSNNQGIVFKIKTDGTSYSRLVDFNGTQGSNPHGSLISDGSYMYGMTSSGGTHNLGVVFRLGTDNNFIKLHDFLDYDVELGDDGATPYGDLYYDGSYLYGMTSAGGVYGNGVIFKISTNGDSYGVLYDFGSAVSDGSSPYGSLISDGTFLYGMTSSGGSEGEGTVFKIKTDGTSYAKLLDFSWDSDGISDGATPNGSLTYDGTFLYGMTSLGSGNSGNTGIMFKIKPDGTGYTKLQDFGGVAGAQPQGSLLLVNTTLYGLTQSAGIDNSGTLFQYVIPPVATITINTQPSNGVVCNGATTQFTTAATGTTNIAYQWQYSSDGVVSYTDLTNTGGYSNVSTSSMTINSTGNFGAGFYRCQVNGDFAATVYTNPVSFTVNTLPQAPTTSDVNNCGPASLTLSATGASNGSYIWYDQTQAVITGQSNSSYTTPVITTTSSYSVAVTNGTCVSPKVNITATISPVPATPTVSNASNCGPGSVTLSASGASNGNYIWYDQTQTVITGQNNSSYTTPVLTATSSYSVSVTNGTCISPKANSTVTINSIPGSPTSASVSNCGPGSVTFTASGGTNGNYIWYDQTSTAITSQSNSTYTTPVLSASANFSVAIINGTCVSPPTSVSATINPIPAAPSVQGATGCAGATFLLSASGGTNGQYTWYTAASGGSAITGQSNNTYTTSVTSSTTFYVSINNGICESPRTPVAATVNTAGCSPPVIATTPLATQIGGVITLNLIPLITTSNNNLDTASLKIILPPSSGATATISSSGVLTINYNGINFTGDDQISIQACDKNGNCSTQKFSVDVAGDIIVYNGISPNGMNPTLVIQYIDVLPETKNNSVHIFDRWENQVWHGTNYDNSSVVFKGVSDSGSDLPTGVYFYKIDFTSGHKSQAGFISLRR